MHMGRFGGQGVQFRGQRQMRPFDWGCVELRCKRWTRASRCLRIGGNFRVFGIHRSSDKVRNVLLSHKLCLELLTIHFGFVVLSRNRLPKNRPILHSFMMGTHESLNAQQNIVAMTYMESEVIRLAKQRNCHGILTTNTSPLTQQLARNVFGYETMLDYQVNEYAANGRKPFENAPDSYRAIVQWKKLWFVLQQALVVMYTIFNYYECIILT